MGEFHRAKTKVPPGRLPNAMRDHKLTGPLSGFKECHLAGDILLVYEHENDVVTLHAVCTHEDIDGSASKEMAKIIEARRP
jgi:addiction module RelE/StbE family toxin